MARSPISSMASTTWPIRNPVPLTIRTRPCDRIPGAEGRNLWQEKESIPNTGALKARAVNGWCQRSGSRLLKRHCRKDPWTAVSRSSRCMSRRMYMYILWTGGKTSVHVFPRGIVSYFGDRLTAFAVSGHEHVSFNGIPVHQEPIRCRRGQVSL